MTLTTWGHYERVLWALTLWREASNQPFETRLAIAHAIQNRVARPSWWGKNLIAVLTKREQFTSINTVTNDPNLRRWPQQGDLIFAECLQIVDAVADGCMGPVFPGADSYYDDSIPAPWWTKSADAKYLGQSGRLHFYDMDHDWEGVSGPTQET